jgi:hypothetical protein
MIDAQIYNKNAKVSRKIKKSSITRTTVRADIRPNIRGLVSI